MDRKRSREYEDPCDHSRKHARGDSTPLEKGKYFVLRNKHENEYRIFDSFDCCRPYVERSEISIVAFDTRQEAENFARRLVLDSNAIDQTSPYNAMEAPCTIASAHVSAASDDVNAKRSEEQASIGEQVSEVLTPDQSLHLHDAVRVEPEERITVYANGTTSTTSRDLKMSFGVYFKDKSPYNCAGFVTGSVSSQRADLKAALEAIKIITRHNMVKQGGVIELCVNSSYVKSGFESWMRRWKERGWKNANKRAIKNADLWKEVDSLLSELEKVRVRVEVSNASGSPGSFNAGMLAARVMYQEKRPGFKPT